MNGLATGALTEALLAAVWQGMLLAAVAGLGLRLLPKTPAAIRFAIWFGVFLIVAALPLASLWPHAAGSAASGHGAWLTLDARWSFAIAAIWLVASVVRAVTLVAAGFRVRALWKRAVPVEISRLPDRIHGGETAMNGASRFCGSSGRGAQLCVSDEVDRPTVIGFFAPKILLPAWLLEKLTAAELEQIVLHESGHLGRADDWMNLLQKIALVMFPLNPALAWVERRLCFERELAVDERVLRAFAGTAGAAKAYAACLATLAEHRMGRREIALAGGIMIGALGRESELGRRVGRILRRGEMMRPLQAKLVLGGAMLGLLGASAGLERCPHVIGFSAPAAPDAVGLAAARTDTPIPAGASYLPASYRNKRFDANGLTAELDVQHLSLLKAAAIAPANRQMASQAGKPVEAGGGFGMRTVFLKTAGESTGVETERRQPAASQTRAQSHTGAAGGARMVQWVVIRSWQSGDGSRLVMTTESTQVPTARKTQTTTDARPDQPSEQVRLRYAVLPVQDGWVVFQL